jgi:hypothetical protein
LDELMVALRTGSGGPFPPAPAVGLVLMDVVFDDLEFQEGTDLPKRTSKRLLETYHLESCSLKYLDYLRERVRY